MRNSLMAQASIGILCVSICLVSGCGNPVPQALAFLTVTASPANLSVGGAALLKAEAHLSDGTTQDVTPGTQWTLSNSALANVSSGALTATAPGIVTVHASYLEATPAGNSPASTSVAPENLGASAQVNIATQASTAVPSLTWNPPAAITYGTALGSAQLNATAGVPGTFQYSPAAGTVLKAGTQTLSVVFTPDDTKTYSSVNATVEISVERAIPTIDWPLPAPIVQGTPLSGTQLNAAANIPGTFVYKPAAGTVPTAGTLVLTATFTPTYAENYISHTAYNTVTVVAPLATPAAFEYSGSPVANTLMPPSPATPISPDFFGMTIEHTFTPFPAFGVSTERFWDVDPWQTVEPSNGEFVWTGMDDSISIGKKNGVIDYIYTFGNVPSWASTNPSQSCTDGPGTCAPPNMTDFDEFVTEVVQRYCGTITYYETWNEPNNPKYWSGTSAQLLTVAQHVYQIAKDPANCGCANGICAPNAGGNPNHVLIPAISQLSAYNLSWLDAYLGGAGAKYPYADTAAFHGYGTTEPEDIASQVGSLQQILAKHGMSNLQLWNTEASWGSIDPVGQSQASWLIRYHIALATTGVSRFVWYAYDNCYFGTLWEGYCVDPQMPIEHTTEGATAYATVESWLSGANLSNCEVYENGLWACELQRSGGYQAWILWSSNGAQITVPISQDFGLTVFRDWQNNVNPVAATMYVDQMPMLLENHDL